MTNAILPICGAGDKEQVQRLLDQVRRQGHAVQWRLLEPLTIEAISASHGAEDEAYLHLWFGGMAFGDREIAGIVKRFPHLQAQCRSRHRRIIFVGEPSSIPADLAGWNVIRVPCSADEIQREVSGIVSDFAAIPVGALRRLFNADEYLALDEIPAQATAEDWKWFVDAFSWFAPGEWRGLRDELSASLIPRRAFRGAVEDYLRANNVYNQVAAPETTLARHWGALLDEEDHGLSAAKLVLEALWCASAEALNPVPLRQWIRSTANLHGFQFPDGRCCGRLEPQPGWVPAARVRYVIAEQGGVTSAQLWSASRNGAWQRLDTDVSGKGQADVLGHLNILGRRLSKELADASGDVLLELCLPLGELCDGGNFPTQLQLWLCRPGNTAAEHIEYHAVVVRSSERLRGGPRYLDHWREKADEILAAAKGASVTTRIFRRHDCSAALQLKRLHIPEFEPAKEDMRELLNRGLWLAFLPKHGVKAKAHCRDLSWRILQLTLRSPSAIGTVQEIARHVRDWRRAGAVTGKADLNDWHFFCDIPDPEHLHLPMRTGTTA